MTPRGLTLLSESLPFLAVIVAMAFLAGCDYEDLHTDPFAPPPLASAPGDDNDAVGIDQSVPLPRNGRIDGTVTDRRVIDRVAPPTERPQPPPVEEPPVEEPPVEEPPVEEPPVEEPPAEEPPGEDDPVPTPSSPPVDIAFPLTTTVQLSTDPSEAQCFRFELGIVSTLSFTTSDGAGGCPADTTFTMFDANRNVVGGSEDGAGGCSPLHATRDRGEYVVCASLLSTSEQPGPVAVEIVASQRPRLTLTEVAAAEGGARFVEIHNPTNHAATLVGVGIDIFADGADVATAHVAIADETVVLPGELFVITADADAFRAAFQATPSLVEGALVLLDGDDAVTLTLDGDVIDVYGVVGVGGAGAPWSYVDASAARRPEVSTPADELDLDEWTIATGVFTPGAR